MPTSLYECVLVCMRSSSVKKIRVLEVCEVCVGVVVDV